MGGIDDFREEIPYNRFEHDHKRSNLFRDSWDISQVHPL